MKRRTKILLWSAVGLAAAVVGARLALNGYVVRKVVRAIEDEYRVLVAIDDLDLEVWNGRAVARRVAIHDQGHAVVTIETVELSAAWKDVIGARYDFKKLVLHKPVLRIEVEEGGTNLARIVARRPPPRAGPDDVVVFRDLLLAEGEIVFEDTVTDPSRPAKLDVRAITGTAAQLQLSGKPETKGWGDFRLDGVLVQRGAAARVSLVGWAAPLEGKPTLQAHAAVTGLDLAQIPQYVTSGTRTALGGDVMHIVGSMRVEAGVIKDGAMVGDIPAMKSTLPMKFGGTLSDPVFDEDSKLAAIFHLPFAHIGHLGDVALTSAWSFTTGSLGDVGGGVFGAGESVFVGAKDMIGGLTRLDPLGALSSAGGGVVGGLKSIGEGLLGGVTRLFTGGDSPAESAEIAAKLRAETLELHRARRRAMLEAALASAKDGEDKRRARIEKELEAPPPPDGE
jgi:hypothetical protein